MRAATPLVPRADFLAAKGGTKLLVLVAPLDARAKALQGSVEHTAEVAVDASDRFEALRGIDAFDATAANARAVKEVEARKLMAEAKQALDDLDSAKASKLYTDAIAAWQAADLTRGLEGLVEAWTGKAAGHSVSEENPQAKVELEKVLVLAPKTKFSDAQFPPELLKYAEGQRRGILKAKGKLTVRTEPPGARVWVDGVFKGTSPVTAEGVASGQHMVVAALGGWSMAADDLPPGDHLLKLKPAESAFSVDRALERIAKDPEGPQRDAAARELGDLGRADQVLLLVVKRGSGDALEATGLRLDVKDGHNFAYAKGTFSADFVSSLLGLDTARVDKEPVTHFAGAAGRGVSGLRIGGFALLGGAVVAAVSWGIFGFSALDRAKLYASLFQVQAMQSNNAASQGRTFALVADISWAVGAALLVAGLLLVILGGGKSSGSAAAEKLKAPQPDPLEEYRRQQEEQRRADEDRQKQKEAEKQQAPPPPAEEAKPPPPEEKKPEEKPAPPPEEKKKKLTPAEERAERKRKAAEEKAEKKRKAEEEKAEKKRKAQEEKQRKAEEKKQAEEEKKRAAEEEKKKTAEEKQRAADEKKKADEDKKRAAEEEKRKLEEDKKAIADSEKQRKADEEKKKAEEEEQKKKAADDARRADEERKRNDEEQKEREISLKTGEAIAAALESRGHEVVRVVAGPRLDETLRKARIDVAFLALHGRMGEDGKVQGLLEVLGIPYTGSGVLASALAMNKPVAKRLFRDANLATPVGCATKPGQTDLPDVGLPCIVKPSIGGSSVGLSFVRHAGELERAIADASRFGGEALVERYVEGREVTVGILGDEVIGALEISHEGRTFDYQAKYQAGTARYHTPPRLSATRTANVEAMALRAYQALGCRGYARVDFICSENGHSNDVLLEVNTLPGMTATSLLPKIAAKAGLDFPTLCERILRLAAVDAAEPIPESKAA